MKINKQDSYFQKVFVYQDHLDWHLPQLNTHIISNNCFVNMKNPEIEICSLLESRMNGIILKINQTHDIFEADKLHSELRILD